jgi:hypothetical protein
MFIFGSVVGGVVGLVVGVIIGAGSMYFVLKGGVKDVKDGV